MFIPIGRVNEDRLNRKGANSAKGLTFFDRRPEFRVGELSEKRLEAVIGRRLGGLPVPVAGERNLAEVTGLVGWAEGHLEHPEAGRIMELALGTSSGAVRKAGLTLAAALGRADLLESMAVSDPNKGVRDRAQQLAGKMGNATQQKLF